MASNFAASTVKTRYIAAGSIPVLKSDWTNICSDLVALETYAATSSDQAGKFTKILLAGASTGASSLLSGGGVSEVTVTPATNIPLHHLDVGSKAATGTGNRGCWNSLSLAEVTATPATNISIRHLGSTSWLETTTDGHWKSISLGTARTVFGSGGPFTNIGLLNLRGATALVRGNVNTSNSLAPSTSYSYLTQLGSAVSSTASGAYPHFFMTAWYTGLVSGTAPGALIYMYGMGGFSAAGGAVNGYQPLITLATQTASSSTVLGFQVEVLQVSEI
jgi:hypothetical protein